MWILLLDLWDFVKHVPVNNRKGNIILPISDIILQVHRVGISLNQHIVLSHRLIHLLTFAAINDQNYQVAG